MNGASQIDSYRSKAQRLVAGVMSGTSLDAIDIAFVRVGGTGAALGFELLGFQALPIDDRLRGQLVEASEGRMTLREAFELDTDLGALYAEAIAGAAALCDIDAGDIDAVGLHGQTVYHAPYRRPNGLTVQLGSAAIVAERLRTIVVDDFRSADVAAGGEGAPLVPYCDFVLLHARDCNRVALNIGGIANITWLPRDCSAEQLVAFDTGPGNMLIDAAMRELYGRDYDADGAIAGQGSADERWLEELLRDEYFHRAPPKSSGRERFGENAGRRLARAAHDRGLATADVIATLTLLTARSIALGIRRFASADAVVDEVVVGGGGAHNTTMMAMLGAELAEASIVTADRFGLPSDAKEAIAFAILANETLMETPAAVPSVTGASRPVICGAIHLA